MPEGTVRLPPDSTGTRLRTVTNPAVAGGANQEVVTLAGADGAFLDVATQATLAAVLVELGQKLEAGQAVALDAGTLAALESINAAVTGTVAVSNFPGTQAVSGPLTDAQLRATPVPVSGTVTATGGLTDAELRATPVPVSGTLAANLGTIDGAATEATLGSILTELGQKLEAGQAVALDAATLAALETINAVVSGTVAVSNHPANLTDAQLRASPVPVSFPADEAGLTDAELRATPVPVSGTVTATTGGLTNTELRASPVPVSGTVATGGLTDAELRATAVPVSTGLTPLTDSQLRATAVPVSGPLTDAQLRAANVGVSVSNFPATVEVSNDVGNPLPVSGTLALDGPTLAALETVTIAATLVLADANNSTATPLAAGATFTGTATNISTYQQINVMLFGTPSTASGSLFFEFSPNGTNWDISVPILVEDPTYFIPYPLINVGLFFRLRYLNDGGAAFHTAVGSGITPATPVIQTVFRLTTQLHTLASKELARTLGQPINDSQPASLVRSAILGKNPNGAYVNQPLGGTKTITPATSVLIASGVYTSDWMDTEQFPTIRLVVAADVISALNGILFQWSDTPTGVVVRSSETRSFRAGHIANGRVVLTGTRTRYLRVIYTNGLQPQTRFFLNLRLNPVPLTDLVRLESTSSGQTTQQDVTTSATQIAISALAGRRTLRISNLTTSARPMFYGFSSGLTVLNGDELAVGAAVDLDVDEFVTVFVVTTSTGGSGVRCGTTEIA